MIIISGRAGVMSLALYFVSCATLTLMMAHGSLRAGEVDIGAQVLDDLIA